MGALRGELFVGVVCLSPITSLLFVGFLCYSF